MQRVDLKIMEPDQWGGMWPDLTAENFVLIDATRAIVMANGTEGGRSAIQLMAKDPETGKWIALQITARMLDMIHGAWKGAKERWKEPD